MKQFRSPFVPAALLAVLTCACNSGDASKDAPAAPTALTEAMPEAPVPVPPAALAPEAEPVATAAEEPPEPWKGPFFVVTRSSTGIYANQTFERSQKIGYLVEGAKVAVHEGPVRTDNCRSGWHQLVDGGYVCGKHGTTNPADERARHAPKQPNLEAVLPYTYARNTTNGTPLYRGVPTKEQVRTYEPYLFEDSKKKGEAASKVEKTAAAKPAPSAPVLDEATRKAKEDQQRRMAALRAARRAMLGEAAAAKLAEAEQREAAPRTTPTSAAQADNAEAAADAGAAREWWQKDDVELHRIKLDELAAHGDDVISKRMIKGFYIAVERTFDWDKRRWYRSTKGDIAPADRFVVTQGSDFKGVELDETWQLPIGWVYGWKDSKPRYELDDAGKFKPSGSVKHFEAVNLTGKEQVVGKTTYVESVDGFWVRKRDLRITRPGPVPADVGALERWIDVNLSTQTVILFEGARPIYATLISSGKEHTVKEKDHRTPSGEFRIREKHITATMDGDGSAAGDLPYSIEAVPYVMYFEGSYALHGAFWHRNYGVRMSHGCVNLAPLDAKYIFFNTSPSVEQGWAGAWATAERPGSRVVVHE